MRRLIPFVLALAACSAAPGPPEPIAPGVYALQAPQAAQEPPVWAGPAFFHALVGLTIHAPLDAPVKLVVEDLDGMWGQARYDDEQGCYVIRMDKDIPGPGADWAIDVLVHEWAHCLVWGAASWEDPHGPLWGVAVARCYRVACDPGWEHEGCDEHEEPQGEPEDEPADD